MNKLYVYAQSKTVKHILGTHTEMTKRQGIDYPFDAKVHNNEHDLPLKMYHLEQLINWLSTATSPIKKKVFEDFILYPTD